MKTIKFMLIETTKLILLVSLAISQFAHAAGLTVDKMFIIADKNKNGIVTLTNTSNLPLFVNATVDEFQLAENGTDFIKTRYDANNVEEWKISTTLNKIVLHPGESNNVGVRSLCYNIACDDSRDLMFFVTFMPSPYKEGGESTSSMQLNYGFSPAFIIPTSQPQVDYEITATETGILVENRSNTMIYVSVDGCERDPSAKACFNRYIVVAGRTKEFELSENAKGHSLKLNISSHDGSYSDNKLLLPNGVVKG